MRDPQRAPTSAHAAFAALGVAFLAVFSWVYLGEQGAEWRRQQAEFRRLERAVKNPHQLAQAARVDGLRQVWLPDLDRVDRCTTCHLGIDDAAFGRAPQPFRVHGGTWLTTHPVERFGCTVCHEGQGQATDYGNAAHSAIPFVARPMRPLETIEASCGACHRSLDPPDAPALSAGRVVFGDGMHQSDGATLHCWRRDGQTLWQLPLPGTLVHLEGAPAVACFPATFCWWTSGAVSVSCTDIFGNPQGKNDGFCFIGRQVYLDLQRCNGIAKSSAPACQ